MPKTAQQNTVNTLPNSVEAEQNVLCCILKDPTVQLDIISALQPSDFYQRNHVTIFEAMQAVAMQATKDENGNVVTNTVSFATLADKLRRDGTIDMVGSEQYLNILQDALPSAAHYQEYVSLVKRASVMRQMISACGDITKLCYSSDSSEEVITYAEERIFKLSQGDSARDLVDLSGQIAHTLKKINDRFISPEKFHGIDTGFYKFDKMTNGLHGGELVVLAARPGVGKSAMAMNIVEHVAKKGKTVAVFSLEMSNEQLVERMLSSMSGIPLAEIKSGQLRGGEADIVKLQTVHETLANMHLFGNDTANIRPAEIASQCRRLKAKSGLDMVVVDYIQLMNGDKVGENRQTEVAYIVRSLKLLAKELNVPVLALSQLKREAETRNIATKNGGQASSTPPVLSDIRESGAIEQDADIVLFIHKDNPDDHNNPDVKLIVAKHRSGETGEVNLKWIGSLVRFVNAGDVESALKPMLAAESERPSDYTSDESAIFSDETEDQTAFVDESQEEG